ncbi:hypothetical protein FB451DRAFT_1046217, partial [Mycena latifolia]
MQAHLERCKEDDFAVTDDGDTGEDESFDILEYEGSERPRVLFHDDHLESDTHLLKVKAYSDRKVPVPIGSALPRRDLPQFVERHARLMLILFKPWRHAEDLRHLNQKWSEAYAHFLTICSPEVVERIDNMQILHECKDSRDAHFSNRR